MFLLFHFLQREVQLCSAHPPAMLSEINICTAFVYTDIKVLYIWGWIVMGPLTTLEVALLEPRERAYLTLNTSSLTSVFWHQIWLVSQWLQANSDVMNTRGPTGSGGMQMNGASRHLGAGRLVLEEIKVLPLSMQKYETPRCLVKCFEICSTEHLWC